MRLRTPPVAVKFLEDEDFPEGVVRPSKMGVKIAVCQAVAAARFMFWTVGMNVDDDECVPSMVLFGWAEPENEDVMVEFFTRVGHVRNEEAGRELIAKIPRFDVGEFCGLLFAPLRRCSFEPDVVVIYGNAAQIGRLIFARSYFGGGAISTELFGRAVSCAEAVIKPFKAGDCTVAIPGAGDRVFALVGDDELIFSLPVNWLDDVIEGVKRAGRGLGLRYPMPRFLLYKPLFPPDFQTLRSKVKIVKRNKRNIATNFIPIYLKRLPDIFIK